MISKGIYTMWNNWTVSVGFVCLLSTLGPCLPPKFVPVFALFLDFILICISHKNTDNRQDHACYKLTYIIEITLFISAILLTVVYVYVWKMLGTELTGQAANPNNPQIPILITGPVATLVSLYFVLRGQRSTYCIACMRKKVMTERGFLGKIYSRESHYQQRFFLVYSFIVSVVGVGYYFLFYVNESISKTDWYVFVYIPLIIYILSVVYLGIRYYGIKLYYCNSEVTAKYLSISGTVVRYLIICENEILLAAPKSNITPLSTDDLKIDTPVKFSFSYRDNYSIFDAIDNFKSTTGINSVTLRELYANSDQSMYQSTLHMAAYIPPEDKEEVAKKLNAEWFTLTDINKMNDQGMIATALAIEIHRIYTIALAWKTYDSRGRRRYKIKHYQPSFKLKDLHKIDVDFNDSSWFYVAKVNQDVPFYRLRRFWDKIFIGNFD